jgi:hypothetical protein
MSKKMMLLALAVVSAAVFVLPAAASAAENHIEGVTAFTGSAGAGTLAATGEPTITCDSTDINKGVVSAGGTTGTMELDFTGCHTAVFGITAACKTEGAPLNNTILSSGTFHMITLPNKEAGILVTPVTTTIVCAGISKITVEGNLIGTITKPACNAAATNTMLIDFSATGSTQNLLEYTGVKYDLTAQTSGGSKVTAGLTSVEDDLVTTGTFVLNCT